MLPYVGYVVLIEWTVKLILELFGLYNSHKFHLTSIILPYNITLTDLCCSGGRMCGHAGAGAAHRGGRVPRGGGQGRGGPRHALQLPSVGAAVDAAGLALLRRQEGGM